MIPPLFFKTRSNDLGADLRLVWNSWNKYLAPWVSQDPSMPFFTQPSASHTPFLQAVQLYLAARHVQILSPPPATLPHGQRSRTQVLQSLEAETQRHLFHVILGGSMDSSSIKALHALSLFADALSVSAAIDEGEGSSAGHKDRLKMYDGESLMASAVRMANSLSLELDVQTALEYVEESSVGKVEKDGSKRSKEEVLERSRLVSTVLCVVLNAQATHMRPFSSALALQFACVRCYVGFNPS